MFFQNHFHRKISITSSFLVKNTYPVEGKTDFLKWRPLNLTFPHISDWELKDSVWPFNICSENWGGKTEDKNENKKIKKNYGFTTPSDTDEPSLALLIHFTCIDLNRNRMKCDCLIRERRWTFTQEVHLLALHHLLPREGLGHKRWGARQLCFLLSKSADTLALVFLAESQNQLPHSCSALIY